MLYWWWQLFKMVAPKFTINIKLGGENLASCLVGLKTPPTIMSWPGFEPPASCTTWNVATEVPCSYPLVHRGVWSFLSVFVVCKGLSEEVRLWCLVGRLIFLWSMLLGDGLEVCGLPGGDDLQVFFGASGRLGSWADNVPSRTLVDSAGIVLGVTDRWPRCTIYIVW